MQNEFNNNPSFPCADPSLNTANFTAGVSYSNLTTGELFEQGCGADPLSQISAMSLPVSLVCLFVLYLVCYLISWIILWRPSADHEI